MRKPIPCVLSLVIILCLSTTPAFSASVSLNPTIDTWVERDWNSGNTPHGASDHLNVGNSYDLFRSFLKFDLITIPDDSIITSASIDLYCYRNIDPETYTVNHIISDSSVTDSMIWSSQPSRGANLGNTTISTVGNPIWVSWDLLGSGNWNYTNDLTDNFASFGLWNNDSVSSPGPLAQFYSNESIYGLSAAPQLNLVFSEVPVPPTILLLFSGIIGSFGLRKKFRK